MQQPAAWLAASAFALALLAAAPGDWTRNGLWFLAGACAGAAGCVFWLHRSKTDALSRAWEPPRPAPTSPRPEPPAPQQRPAPPAEEDAESDGSGADADPWTDSKNADGIGYLKDKPAWFVRVVHPARFGPVEHDIEFRVFLFPSSALVAVLLRFFDNPSNPYCFHRVFDLADAPTERYLRQVESERRWTVVVNGRGTEAGFSRDVEVPPDALTQCLEEGGRHLSRLRVKDGARAVEEFLRVFKSESNKAGFHAGWNAVAESIRRLT